MMDSDKVDAPTDTDDDAAKSMTVVRYGVAAEVTK
jgi:hypothetical protein